MGVLCHADRNLLILYCQTWARWEEAEVFLSRYGSTYPLKDEAGRMRCFMPHPQVSIAYKLSTTLVRLGQELGLSPSARTRISVGLGGMPRPALSPLAQRFFGPPVLRTCGEIGRGEPLARLRAGRASGGRGDGGDGGGVAAA